MTKENIQEAIKRVEKNTYTLTINGKQAQVIKEACELYERLHAGQWFALENILPLKEGIYPYMLEEAMKEHIEPLINENQLKFERVSGDIMQVIRHRLSWDRYPEGGWTVNYQKAIKLGSEPLPIIERV